MMAWYSCHSNKARHGELKDICLYMAIQMYIRRSGPIIQGLEAYTH